MDSLRRIGIEVGTCSRCPRLVAWREQVAIEKRASFRDDTYWARGVPGFGDPAARILVLGLAPAAHGANRTGRVFTGDRSGDFLFRSMYTVGLANQPTSTTIDDGLTLQDTWITAPVKCAPPDNAPLPVERDECRPFLARELALLPDLRVVVCLGNFAFQVACQQFGVQPRPKFGHGIEAPSPSGLTLLCSFHPSQQNTFTGRLTQPMLDAIFGGALPRSRQRCDERQRRAASVFSSVRGQPCACMSPGLRPRAGGAPVASLVVDETRHSGVVLVGEDDIVDGALQLTGRQRR